MIKSIVFMVSFFSLCSAGERQVQLLFPIEQEADNVIGLSDFNNLKDRTKRLCKILPRTISSEFANISRTHSDGQIDKEEIKLDCESINMLVRIECHQAATVLSSISTSSSLLSTNTALEFYDIACGHYKNALYHIIAAFKLNCYRTMDKLYQVLIAFTQAESDATQKQSTRKLDPAIQKIYHSLEEIVRTAEVENNIDAPVVHLPKDNTSELVRALGIKAKSLQQGQAYLEAGKTLLSSLKDPSLESLNSIEITFFLAVEHFITAYYRDSDQGLDEAESALVELEKVHIYKKNTFGKAGQRYALAKRKLEEAKNMGEKVAARDRSSTNESSLEKFLRDDATQNKAPSSTDTSQEAGANKKQPAKRTTTESNKTMKKDGAKADSDPKDEMVLLYIPPRKADPIPDQNRTTPLSLIKSVGRHCKNAGKGTARAVKYLWNKLPF